jgi:hypothetical protein
VVEGSLKGAYGVIDRIVDTTADVIIQAGSIRVSIVNSDNVQRTGYLLCYNVLDAENN